MTRMQILLDEDKIRREKKYDAQKIHDYIDSVFLQKCGLQKSADGFYTGAGDRNDLLRFGKANYMLHNKTWFLDNVKVWLFFCNDDTDDPDEYVVEDVKDFYAKKYSIAL